MSYIKRPFGLILLLLMILTGLQVALKKPVCIDSSIVYKIDNIEDDKTMSMYACNQYKMVPYAPFLAENLMALQGHISHLEFLFKPLQLSQKFIIKIDHTSQGQMQELNKEIYISSDLVGSDLIDKYLTELIIKSEYNIEDKVLLQSLSDFLIDDGVYQNRISEAWNSSLKELNFFKRRKLFKNLLFRQDQLNFNENRGAIEKLGILIDRTFDLADSLHLSSSFYEKLEHFGYYKDNQLSDLKLDYIIENLNMENQREILTVLTAADPTFKVGLKNSEGLFLLPSNFKIPRNLESKIVSKTRIIFDLKETDKSSIERNINRAESLILIRPGTDISKLKLEPLISKGINEFLYVNKQIDFIQIHLPSYKLIYKDLTAINDYFKFVKYHESFGREHKSLGWDHSEWLKDLRVYKPIANYDVIQYFRIN